MHVLRQQKFWVIFCLITLFYFIFASIIPLAQDDWEWYVTGYDQWFNRHFEDLNGRYIGNIIEILVVRNLLLRMVVYAVVSSSIVWMILRLIHKTKSTVFLVITFTALLWMPNTIFKQTYAWFAGFNNYVTSAVCALIILGMVIQLIYHQGQLTSRMHRVEVLGFFATCIVGQLLMETISLYNIAMTGLGLVLYFVLYRKINLKLLAGFLLTLLGAFIMFTNPNYLNILAGKSDYQSVGSNISLYDKVLQTLLRVIPYYGYINCALFLTILALVMVYVLYHSPKFLNLAKVYKVILTLGLVFFPLYKYVIYDSFNLASMVHIPWIAAMNCLACMIYFISMTVGVYFVGFSKEASWTAFMCLASIIIVEIPLIVVSPVGPRSFYFVFLLWLIILLLLLKQIPLPKQPTTLLFGIIALGSCVLFIGVFSFMTYANDQRITKLKQQAAHYSKHQKITVENLPFEAYTQHTSPWNKKTTDVFKQYWGIPQKVQLKFVPYGDEYKQEKALKEKKAKEKQQEKLKQTK